MKTNANDPATGYGFTTADGSSHVDSPGLTKREQFAMVAMNALLTNSDLSRLISYSQAYLEETGRQAVVMADVLISALNKEV